MLEPLVTYLRDAAAGRQKKPISRVTSRNAVSNLGGERLLRNRANRGRRLALETIHLGLDESDLVGARNHLQRSLGHVASANWKRHNSALRFFEGARASFWRALGRSYKDLADAQIAMPVIEAHCNYKRPARYEDIIVVETHITDVRAASLRFLYEVKRGNELLAEGYTRHAVIGPGGKPRALPDFMRQLVSPKSE